MTERESLIQDGSCTCFDAPYKVAPECPTHGEKYKADLVDIGIRDGCGCPVLLQRMPAHD